MSDYSLSGLQKFKNEVGIKFQLFNSLFTGLPFHRIEKTGILLSVLLDHCEEGYKKSESPTAIIENFFSKQFGFKTREEQMDLLFRFIQFIERQVVLFDALEDAAFSKINDMQGLGTLKHLESTVVQNRAQTEEQVLAVSPITGASRVLLEEKDDVYGRADTSVDFKINASMLARLQWLFTWDNTPAAGQERVDNLYLLTLGWKF